MRVGRKDEVGTGGTRQRFGGTNEGVSGKMRWIRGILSVTRWGHFWGKVGPQVEQVIGVKGARGEGSGVRGK